MWRGSDRDHGVFRAYAHLSRIVGLVCRVVRSDTVIRVVSGRGVRPRSRPESSGPHPRCTSDSLAPREIPIVSAANPEAAGREPETQGRRRRSIRRTLIDPPGPVPAELPIAPPRWDRDPRSLATARAIETAWIRRSRPAAPSPRSRRMPGEGRRSPPPGHRSCRERSAQQDTQEHHMRGEPVPECRILECWCPRLWAPFSPPSGSPISW